MKLTEPRNLQISLVVDVRLGVLFHSFCEISMGLQQLPPIHMTQCQITALLQQRTEFVPRHFINWLQWQKFYKFWYISSRYIHILTIIQVQEHQRMDSRPSIQEKKTPPSDYLNIIQTAVQVCKCILIECRLNHEFRVNYISDCVLLLRVERIKMDP